MNLPRIAIAVAIVVTVAGIGAAGAIAQGPPDDVPQGPPDKVTICHVPPDDPANATTQNLPEPAAEAHLENHELDYGGECTDQVAES